MIEKRNEQSHLETDFVLSLAIVPMFVLFLMALVLLVELSLKSTAATPTSAMYYLPKDMQSGITDELGGLLMAHIHILKDGQKTGQPKSTVSGDHVHELPNGQFTDPSPESKTHVHTLPDGSTTPGGPMPVDDADPASPDLKLSL